MGFKDVDARDIKREDALLPGHDDFFYWPLLHATASRNDAAVITPCTAHR
jgi:hypothetical protein